MCCCNLLIYYFRGIEFCQQLLCKACHPCNMDKSFQWNNLWILRIIGKFLNSLWGGPWALPLLFDCLHLSCPQFGHISLPSYSPTYTAVISISVIRDVLNTWLCTHFLYLFIVSGYKIPLGSTFSLSYLQLFGNINVHYHQACMNSLVIDDCLT